MAKKPIEPTSFVRDRAMMILSVLNLVLAAVAVLIVTLRLRSHDFKVPAQYLAGDGSVLLSAPWYTLYSLALFAVVGVCLSIFLAYKLYAGNRLFSGGVLVSYIVVGIVSILSINALLGLVARV